VNIESQTVTIASYLAGGKKYLSTHRQGVA
jgi:hypothetical protein